MFNIENSPLSPNRYRKIFVNMQEWFQGLDKITRTHTNIDEKFEYNKINKFRNKFNKYDVNIRGFLFKELLELFEVDKYIDVLKNIKNIKIYLDNYSNLYELEIIKITKAIFDKEYTGSFIQAMKIWSDNLAEEQKIHLYDNTTNRVLGYVVDSKGDSENRAITKLAIILTGLNIGDWNDYTLNEYVESLEKSIDTVVSYVIANELDERAISNNDNVRIILNDKDKRFDIEEISIIGNSVLNNIEEALDEVAESISDNEKRSILIKMLEKYM